MKFNLRNKCLSVARCSKCLSIPVAGKKPDGTFCLFFNCLVSVLSRKVNYVNIFLFKLDVLSL